jgi:hypothetical protein
LAKLPPMMRIGADGSLRVLPTRERGVSRTMTLAV